MEYKLTSYAPGSGCGCKIAPAVLSEILSGKRSQSTYPSLLVGNDSNDDAAVWDLHNGKAMISTVDFFTPIVNNAIDFGRIAAANALSDVYAMGGKPVFANAMLGWPVDDLPLELAQQVMQGAIAVCKQAGIPIAGGHTINIKEPLFGLSVNGLVDKHAIKHNNAGKEGDVLYLTKPIGTGIIATAIKRGAADTAHILAVTESMCSLNTFGMIAAKHEQVHAITDVTGYALLGHLIEMTEGANLSAELDFTAVQIFEGIDAYLQQNLIPDNTYRNWNAFEKKVNGVVDMRSFQLLNDPQTSGGLLLAVAPHFTDAFEELLSQNGLADFAKPIGRLVKKTNFEVNVVLA
jgi:selenide,water dikinase